MRNNVLVQVFTGYSHSVSDIWAIAANIKYPTVSRYNMSPSLSLLVRLSLMGNAFFQSVCAVLGKAIETGHSDGKTDMSDVKSHRPISLFLVIGKTLDSLFINRREYHVFANGSMNDSQRVQEGPVDAIEQVIGFIRNAKTDTDYGAAILVDISGAFDHAWWPFIKIVTRYHAFDHAWYRVSGATEKLERLWRNARAAGCAKTYYSGACAGAVDPERLSYSCPRKQRKSRWGKRDRSRTDNRSGAVAERKLRHRADYAISGWA
ncbi:hypothetical protein Trydic_g22659 [Trypoxylus dichotomus]